MSAADAAAGVELEDVQHAAEVDADKDEAGAGKLESLLRPQNDGQTKVGFMELFFDLVYVFAITQLSHFLLKHLDPLHAVQALVMFMAVWWAWIFTTWATNWIDPDRAPVRMLLAGVMLASLVLSSAIPFAFGKDGQADAGLLFALCYVAIQLVRTLIVVAILRRARSPSASALSRATAYFALSGLSWIAGGMTDDMTARLMWWAVALGIEYGAPALRFYVPGWGSSSSRKWDISGDHMAERCALFIIIALGEGIIVTGTTFAAKAMSPASAAAFVTAFVGSVAMWWVYFDVGAKRGAEHIEQHDDPGRVARDAFTYWHMPIVAGIVIIAVADAISLAHPFEPVDRSFVVTLIGGAMLFLGGTMQFKRISSDKPWLPLSHVAGLGLFALAGVTGLVTRVQVLPLLIATVVIFIVVGLWEWVSLNGGWIDRLERRGIRVPDWLGRRARARLAALEGLDPRKVLEHG